MKNQATIKRRKKEVKPFERQGKIFAYLMISVGLIHFCIFWVGVNAGSIALAFLEPNSNNFSLNNFQRLFAELQRADTAIYSALMNTLKYYIVHIVKIFLCVTIAYFLYKKTYGHKWFKVLFFLPSMIPEMVYINIFKNFINTYGPIWTLLDSVFGYNMPELLSNPATATPTILFYVLWSGFGPSMLIYVGAMNRIPNEVLEAAELDGCKSFRTFFQIVIPLIWETLATYLILSISTIFLSTGPLLYFVGTDTYTNTQTLSYWIFLQVQGGIYNYPAAIGIFFTVLALPLTFFSRWLLNKVETITY